MQSLIINFLNNYPSFIKTFTDPETANWITDSWIEIVGFSIGENRKMIPTKWKVDLDNMIFSEYRINKSFDTIKEFYYEKERLKTIEFIKE